MTKREKYSVIERNCWSYVVSMDGSGPEFSGPWRYKCEAQQYADELNGALGEEEPEGK